VDSSELDKILTWFAEKGFGLRLVENENGAVSAELTRLPSNRVVAPNYGRGNTDVDAAGRAKQRHLEEE
jgi:hypothetical protein